MITPEYRVDQGTTTSASAIADEIRKVSRQGYDSPLLAHASTIYSLGVSYNVDPALFAAVAYFETHYGMSLLTANIPNGAWDPYTQSGNLNWASISNAYYGGWPVEGSRWGQYPDVQTGIEAFYRLISGEYYSLGQNTIGSIMWGIGGTRYVTGQHAYAPAFENRANYVDDLVDLMNRISTGSGGGNDGNGNGNNGNGDIVIPDVDILPYVISGAFLGSLLGILR